MIDKFCEYLTNKMRKEMPEIDDERAEIILYGVQLIVGELPKIILMLLVATILGILKESLLAFLILLPYKAVVGGVHLKTHIGCFVMTVLVYCGNAYLSLNYTFPNEILKNSIIIGIFVFSVIMVGLYAPADTINMPILTKKERKIKKTLSYIFLIINMLVALFIQNTLISNILIFGTLIQSISITRPIYKLAKNEYGYETYKKQENTL